MTPKQALEKYFGFSDFRSGQEEIINHILNNENVLAVLPTGAGKSLCYQIPALLGDNYSIIISPLIALMKDQVDMLNKEEYIASFINSSLDFRETQKVLSDVRDNKIKLLYVSPERLSNTYFYELVKENIPDYLFIDEAHCISEWGHNFRPSYRKISEFISGLNLNMLSAFTATATPDVRLDILEQLNIPSAQIIVRGFERENLSVEVLRTRKKKEKIYSLIKEYGTPAIIYTSTRKQAEEADSYLRMKGLKCAFYHAGMAGGVRSIIQDDFINGRVDIIAATNAFGMGIDKKDVRLIVHYNIPSSLENYYQEIGRAGRDGKESKAVLLYEPNDEEIQKFLIQTSFPDLNTLRTVYNSLYDFAHVAIGLKPDQAVELNDDFYLLLKKNNISEIVFNSCLREFENNDLVDVMSDYDRSHYFRFLLSTQKLQSYVKQIAQSSLKETILSLLKLYGSRAFTEEVKIDFIKLREITTNQQNIIQENLFSLSSIGIIDYSAPGSQMKIRLKERRIAANQLTFSGYSEKLRENALSKLRSMINFVESSDCRFGIILKYFGEEITAYSCGKCDNCTGLTSGRETIEYIEEIIINTIHEADNRISERDLINILKGISKSGRLSNYSNFGSCTHFQKDELLGQILSLINKNYIIRHDRYLSLSENGLSLLTESTPATEVGEPQTIETDYSLELFYQLRNLRSEIAKKFSQPPEIICTDELLREIAKRKPETQTSLLEIEGMNSRILNKMGDETLFIIKEFLKRHSELPVEVNQLPDNLTTVKKLVAKGYSLDEISSLLKLSDHLVSIQIESLIAFEPETNISKLMQKKEFDLISSKINEGFTSLKEIKNELEEITYAKIRVVLAKKKLS